MSVAIGDTRLKGECEPTSRAEKSDILFSCRLELDKETFKVMWEMSKPGSETEGLFLRMNQKIYYDVEPDQDIPVEWMPDVRSPLDYISWFQSQSLTTVQYQVTRTGLVEGAILGTSFTTFSINTPAYLPYLLARFLAKGGIIVRSSLQHISQVIEGGFTPFKPDALVVCAGIGARFLGGVEDKDVYPIRGQTVLIRAPWVKFGRTFDRPNETAYIIPRRSGDVSGS